MVVSRVQVTGLRELQLAIRKVQVRELGTGLREANKKAAEKGKEGARAEVPVRSGRLKGSIGVRASQRGAEIKAGTASRVRYAPPIHWGWPKRNIRAQPFLYKGVENKIDDIVDLYELLVAAVARQLGRYRKI